MRKKIIYLIFFIIAFFGGIKNDYSLKEIKLFKHSIDIHLWTLTLFVLLATTLSILAISKFNTYKKIILYEAIKVEIDYLFFNHVDIYLELISTKKSKFVSLIGGFFLGIFAIKFASLNWRNTFIKLYAFILVCILASITVYAYVFFIFIVMSIREVYNSDFNKYTQIYPIATDIFEKYNRICSLGLILFWTIGFILIFLSIIVFDANAFPIMAIIGGLILIGYLIFTFYPYYLNRKKISLLKLQTIRKICEEHNMLEKKEFDCYSDMIKYISESPNVMSTNFQPVLISSLAAIISLITPFLSFFK